MVWGIGPYITDYPEQVLLACVVQGWCPKCVNIFFRDALLHIFITRCQALKGDLDSDLSQFLRTREFTDGLIERLPDKALWGNYGIVSPVVVRPIRSLYLMHF